ncbi:hypothetical protein FF1_008351 [Malus domestica]
MVIYTSRIAIYGRKIFAGVDLFLVEARFTGSFPLQQACSKVVPAIALYGIDPTNPEDRKRHIIHSLCTPLSDSLLDSQESFTSGAALCLRGPLVCQNVSGALEEKSTQTNAHMGLDRLVMSLAKHNALIVEPYAMLRIQAGIRILDTGVEEGNSQKRLSAIQMKWGSVSLFGWLMSQGLPLKLCKRQGE